MFITTSRIYEPPQDDADGLRNEESEAVPEFANEENMVHEERQDEQGSEGEQDTEGNMTKQHLVASEEQDEEELRAIQIESQSIMAAECLSHEHASRHVPQLGMKFKTTEDAYSFYNDYAFIVGFSLVKWHTYKCQDKKDHNYGQVTRVTYKCNLSGKRKEDDSTDVSGVRSTRNNKRKISVSGVQSARKNKKKISGTPPTPNPVPNKRKTSTLVPTECPAELVVTLQNGEWTITRLNLEHNHAFASKDQKNKLFS